LAAVWNLVWRRCGGWDSLEWKAVEAKRRSIVIGREKSLWPQLVNLGCNMESNETLGFCQVQGGGQIEADWKNLRPSSVALVTV